MIARFKKYIRTRLHEVVNSARDQDTRLAWHSLSSEKVSQVHLYSYYRHLARKKEPLPCIADTGYRVYSQFEEDGMLLFLFAVLGTRTKTFVDIGSADGINSNCANLAINFGWHGLFIDGKQDAVECGRKYYSKHPDTFLYPPKFVWSRVTRENVNSLIRGAGFAGDVDLLSIDIDGHDYWIWDALECIQPRVVIIETQSQFGYHNIVVPYDTEYAYPPTTPHYFGASAVAMVALARRMGYRLVGANRFGFNTIFIKAEEPSDLIPEVSVESILQHAYNDRANLAPFEAIKEMLYVAGGTAYPGQPVTLQGSQQP